VLRCQDIKYLILKGFYYDKKVGCDESDNFCLFFGIVGALAPQSLSRRKRGAQVADCSEEVLHLELQGLGV
jgi:hypothetical protein